MTTDIFIRTYKDDLPWLVYCLQSISKFCTGFRDVIIVVPEPHKPLLDGFNLTKEKVFTCKEYKNDYLGQQVTKLTANHYSDADFKLFMDADTLFIIPTKPEDFIINEKPFILKTHYSKVGTGIIWKDVTEVTIGHAVEFEYMRRHPMCYHRSTFSDFADHIMKLHGKTVEEYVMSREKFSEFNSLGAFAELYNNDKYEFRNTDDGLPPLHVRQFWSWGGINKSVQDEINNILK